MQPLLDTLTCFFCFGFSFIYPSFAFAFLFHTGERYRCLYTLELPQDPSLIFPLCCFLLPSSRNPPWTFALGRRYIVAVVPLFYSCCWHFRPSPVWPPLWPQKRGNGHRVIFGQFSTFTPPSLLLNIAPISRRICRRKCDR